METEYATVLCPTCMQKFDVPSPHLSELPVELNYDCEVCCRPMIIRFSEDEGEVVAEARGESE